MEAITIIGAGSAAFGVASLNRLIGDERLLDVPIRLHDRDAAALERSTALAQRMARERAHQGRIESSTELARVLDGAAVVILSIAVQREAQWAADRAWALEHGIVHYAENGGPAALWHTARNLGQIMPILAEMERRCPRAWLLNYTNPVARIGTAIRRYSSLRSIGVCHQPLFGYYIMAVLLHEELGIELPGQVRFRWDEESGQVFDQLYPAAMQRCEITAAGLNHFAWALRVKRRADGADLYPALRAACARHEPGFEPLSRKLCELFGLMPTSGDTHICEYLPYTHSEARGTFQRYDIQQYDLARAQHNRRQQIAWVERMASGQEGLEGLAAIPSERAEHLAAALLGRCEHHDEGLNLPNDGYIQDLPTGAIVEVPVDISAGKPQPVSVGALPPAIGELCRRQVAITELCVAGIVEQEHDKLRQALALDPMIDDPAVVDALLARPLDESLL